MGMGIGGCRGWKVDVRLPGKGNSTSHGARPVHQIISMIKWIRTSKLSINNSLSLAGFADRTIFLIEWGWTMGVAEGEWNTGAASDVELLFYHVEILRLFENLVCLSSRAAEMPLEPCSRGREKVLY